MPAFRREGLDSWTSLGHMHLKGEISTVYWWRNSNLKVIMAIHKVLEAAANVSEG